jgi:hypothetical protein
MQSDANCRGQVVPLVLRIREVVTLIPEMKTSYPEGLNGFPQSSEANAGIVFQRKPRPLPFTFVPNHHPLIIL